MKIKKRYWNLIYGNKGFIMSLDMLVAVTIVTLVLIASSYYVTRANTDIIPKTQISKTGSDILSVLQHNNALRGLNKDGIENHMKNILPETYDMKININCTNKVIETSSPLPKDKYISSGERVVVISPSDYCVARYWTWLK